MLLVLVVVLLIVVSFVLGFLLGRTGTRREALRPDQRSTQSNGTPPTLDYIVPATATPLSQLVQDNINHWPSVPGPPRAAVPVPHATVLEPVTALPRVVPEPVARVSQPVVVAAPEPSPVPREVATIKTRTGSNPNQTKLTDPYAKSERVWSEAESARAVALYRSGKSLVPIAHAMNIDQKQVAIHLIRVLFKFGGEIDDLRAAPRNGWQYTDDDVSKMQSYFDAGASIQDIATVLERTVLGVGWRMLDRKML